jgi:hypothetical protein
MFYLEVGDVRPAQDQPRPPPRPWSYLSVLNMDLCKAETGGEAGLGGADVLAHSGQIEEQPATWKVAGCCAVDTLPLQTYWASTR